MLGSLSVSLTDVFPALQVNTLVEYYRQLAQKEKAEREKKKLTKRRNYMHLSVSFFTFAQDKNIEGLVDILYVNFRAKSIINVKYEKL